MTDFEKITEEVWSIYVPNEGKDSYSEWSVGAKQVVQALVWTIVGLLAGQAMTPEIIKSLIKPHPAFHVYPRGGACVYCGKTPEEIKKEEDGK